MAFIYLCIPGLVHKGGKVHIFVLNSSDRYRLWLKSQYILPSCSSAGSGSVSAFIRTALGVAVSGKRCALHHNGQVQMSALPRVRPVCVYSPRLLPASRAARRRLIIIIVIIISEIDADGQSCSHYRR